MRFEEKQALLKDGTLVILRSPEASDAAAMLDYMETIYSDTEFMGRYPEEFDVSPEREADMLENCLKSEKAVMISAFLGETVIGNVNISLLWNRMKMNHRAGMGIAVRKTYWGRGIGEILIREAIATAVQIGYEQIELNVFADNPGARHLYEKFGFEEWGIIRNGFRLKDGSYHDEVMMGLILNERPGNEAGIGEGSGRYLFCEQ